MKNLVIITDSFPWGQGERSFIEPELNYLIERYHITILSRIPMDMRDDHEMAQISDQISLLHYPTPAFGRKARIRAVLSGIFSLVYLDEVKRCFNGKYSMQAFRDINDFWMYAKDFLKWMRRNHLFDDLENTVFYSYWSNISVLALALQKKKQEKLKFFSRIHGYDLYNERIAGGRQVFKQTIEQYINRIFFISKEGMDYYQSELIRNSIYAEKYKVLRLGVKQQSQDHKKRYTEKFLLVSCSSLIPIKRVELIIEALAEIEEPVYWIHFGDGKGEEKINSLAHNLLGIKKNLQYELKGYIENEVLMDFYNQYEVDSFITTSSTEGCPVSIQEAEANGIPIIATDVGAIASMIRGNGVLLKNNPSIVEIKDAILKMIHLSEKQRKEFKKNSFEIWEKYYNLESNVKELINEIETM